MAERRQHALGGYHKVLQAAGCKTGTCRSPPVALSPWLKAAQLAKRDGIPGVTGGLRIAGVTTTGVPECGRFPGISGEPGRKQRVSVPVFCCVAINYELQDGRAPALWAGAQQKAEARGCPSLSREEQCGSRQQESVKFSDLKQSA